MTQPLYFADVLLELPVDDTLREFLVQHDLPIPEDWEWSDNPNTSAKLLGLIQSHPNEKMREHIIAALHFSGQMAHPVGKRAMFQAAHDKPAVLMELIGCQSDVHRAFWLYVHHPDLFEVAAEIEYVDHNVAQANQYELGVHVKVLRDEQSLKAFEQAIMVFYQRRLGCGEACVVHVLDRSHGTQLVSVHVKDVATVSLQFVGKRLARKMGNPNIHMCLEYSPDTGVARTIIKGGASFHEMLCEVFARHLLGVEVVVRKIPAPAFDLSSLRLGLHVPQAIEDGFIGMQIKALTVVSQCELLRLDCSATAAAQAHCVSDLLRAQLPTDHPLHGGWTLIGATLNFYLAPMQGKRRCEVFSVEVTSKGRNNLHKFEEKVRNQLEGYLVSLGIIKTQQTLKATPMPVVQMSMFA